MSNNNTPCSTVAIAILFGSLTFTTATLAARLWLANLWTWRDGGRPLSSSTNIQHCKEALDIHSLPSIYNLLHHSCVFGFILCYSYICENHPPFMHEEKDVYDRDEFLFCLVILVVVGVRSWKRNTQEKKCVERSDDYSAVHKRGIDAAESCTQPTNNNQVAPLPEPENEVLNRNQTEEWKGWMQFLFLLYHYMHATEVYNGIRVLITCYVWLTGFGNFLFFYKTNDYSLPRLLQMLWRLNFLVIFLCLTHGNSYILYYICPLHTFYFLMVYAVMYIGKDKNHTVWWIRFKLGVLALIIFLVWDCNFGIFEGMHSFLLLGEEAVAGAPYGTKWEWYFRSFLDHYSALLGMIFALNLPVVSLFYRKLEARSFGRQWVGKASVLATMMYAFILWANGPLMMEKEQYNTTNPYFGFMPLLLYVYVRNLTPSLRSHSMSLLQEIGKTTLETYAMQHHVWLTTNSKTILVFLPNYRRLNMILVTLAFIAISRKVYELTGVLRNILLPNDRQQCVRSIAALVLVTLVSYMTSFILCRMHLVGTTAVFIISVVFGGLLYQSIMDSTFYEYHSTIKNISDEDDDEDEMKTFMDRSELSVSIARDLDRESIVTKLCPPMIGVLLLFVLGSIWRAIVVAGATSVGPLSPDCAAFANQGTWVKVDVCNESSRAMVYRNNNAASGVCPSRGGAYVWAWDEQPAHAHCRFGYRGESKLKSVMNGRRLLFIGDSMTRNLYHASVRAMGVKNAGAYDATITKHADLMQDLNNASVNFKWAPLASDQLNSLRSMNDSVENGGDGPDLIVMGGGAWDRLHVYATDEDRKSHADTLKALSNDMMKSQILGIHIVWVVPTTINSQALNTEEKRDHMREEDMEAMRAVYSLNGILSSASFVIDGTAFTASRVSESFDGVHYPHQVYDGGAQILFQSLEWLLPQNSETITTPKDISTMPNTVFGILLLALIGIGLVLFDGFLGFSYLACFFVKGVKPRDVYDDVSSEHAKRRRDKQRLKGSNSCMQTRPKMSTSSKVGDDNMDNEIAALLS